MQKDSLESAVSVGLDLCSCILPTFLDTQPNGLSIQYVRSQASPASGFGSHFNSVVPIEADSARLEVCPGISSLLQLGIWTHSM